ncbi:MAG TPA: pseudouridine synthase [Desulfuromonadales bacterium]|nr:pseudouridine synthase [Desulfuromonadales bacterium]
MLQRLQKLIAAAGHCSRREAERLIVDGRVTVDGRTAEPGDRGDPGVNRIEIDGQPVGSGEPRCYLLLNKPSGFVTTASDPAGRQTVLDLVQDVPVRVFPVGRLDLTTSGLLLLTNDGELANQLAHPRHEIRKTYLVRIRGHLTQEHRLKLERGLQLEDGMTAPAKVSHVRSQGGHTWFQITIHEGRNRQVRRMCEKLGHPVSRLKRIGYAFLRLDGVPSGRYRRLTADEVERLRKELA